MEGLREVWKNTKFSSYVHLFLILRVTFWKIWLGERVTFYLLVFFSQKIHIWNLNFFNPNTRLSHFLQKRKLTIFNLDNTREKKVEGGVFERYLKAGIWGGRYFGGWENVAGGPIGHCGTVVRSAEALGDKATEARGGIELVCYRNRHLRQIYFMIKLNTGESRDYRIVQTK